MKTTEIDDCCWIDEPCEEHATKVDEGVSAVLEAFPSDSWREAALRDIVRVAQSPRQLEMEPERWMVEWRFAGEGEAEWRQTDVAYRLKSHAVNWTVRPGYETRIVPLYRRTDTTQDHRLSIGDRQEKKRRLS